MAIEGQFPKSSGDKWHSSEVNSLHDAYDSIKFFKLEVSDTSDFIDLSSVNYKYTITLENIGEAPCFISLSDTATTDDFYLNEGAMDFSNQEQDEFLKKIHEYLKEK